MPTLRNNNDEPIEPVEILYDTPQQVIQQLKKYHLVEFGTRTKFKAHEVIQFKISPQPVFHKNFRLLIENLKQNQAEQLTNLIFSDSSRQVERLYTIFDDLDKDVQFNPVYHAIAKGFIDHDLKLACYTEHQIFDRFYNYQSAVNPVEYDVVYSYFASVFNTKQQAKNFTTTFSRRKYR